MRVAIVADWLTTFGGAEHVLLEMHRVFPGAPIFTTIACTERLGPLSTADIRTTRLQKLFSVIGRHQPLLPLMPRAVESIDLRGFDVVLSSSHAVGKGVIPPPGAVHVCYCHTPVRYAWEMEERYLEDFRIPRVLRPRARAMLKRLRRWDLSTAKRVDRFLANSRETASRIDRIYGRASSVLPPPVDDRFLASPLCVAAPRRRFLAVGRLVPYKRFDLLIQASANLGFPLTIVGKGQEESRLRAMAARSGADVLFAGFIPDRDLPRIYATARAVFFPQFEDAGIVPLEAQACGAPVIALRRGGAMDTVVDGRTGILFPDQTVESIAQAISRFERTMFDPKVVRDHAQAFGAGRFRKKLQEEVENAAVQRDTVRCAKSEI